MQSRSRGNNLPLPPFQGHCPVTATKLWQLVLVMAPGLLQGGGRPLGQDAHWLLRVSMPELCWAPDGLHISQCCFFYLVSQGGGSE